MKQLVYTILFLLFVVIAQAQGKTPTVQQATGLRADGKIWVVMAVCITILLGLILYVIRLDRKISKLEKE